MFVLRDYLAKKEKKRDFLILQNYNEGKKTTKGNLYTISFTHVECPTRYIYVVYLYRYG